MGKITEMISDYTFKNGYKEVVAKTICDGIKHTDYTKAMNTWQKGDEYNCPGCMKFVNDENTTPFMITTKEHVVAGTKTLPKGDESVVRRTDHSSERKVSD